MVQREGEGGLNPLWFEGGFKPNLNQTPKLPLVSPSFEPFWAALPRIFPIEHTAFPWCASGTERSLALLLFRRDQHTLFHIVFAIIFAIFLCLT